MVRLQPTLECVALRAPLASFRNDEIATPDSSRDRRSRRDVHRVPLRIRVSVQIEQPTRRITIRFLEHDHLTSESFPRRRRVDNFSSARSASCRASSGVGWRHTVPRLQCIRLSSAAMVSSCFGVARSA